MKRVVYAIDCAPATARQARAIFRSQRTTLRAVKRQLDRANQIHGVTVYFSSIAGGTLAIYL